MTPLVLVAATFLGGSAFFKARATLRLGMGISVFVVLEAAAALGLVVVGLPGPFSGSAIARWSVPLAVLLLLVSTIDHGRRLKAVRDRRASTEGGRLAAFVKYQSGSTGEADREPPPTGTGRG